MKAVILARVSSREQEEGKSIDAQLENLKKYCQRLNLEIIKTFQITESSTQGERKRFFEMIEFVKAQPESIAIVADCVDRIQRSFKESVLLDELRQAEKIELHFIREGMILNKDAKGSDISRWDFSVMGAKMYVLNLKDNVKRSLSYKLNNGEWTGKAPIGYLNAKDPITAKSTVIIDKERAYLVKKIFDEYATGNYSIGDMTRKIKEWGLTNNTKGNKKLHKSQVHTLLQNPFYYGVMNVKGKEYPHKYEKIIDEFLFKKCKDVRLNYSNKPLIQSKHEFIFRGLIKCADCGCTITTDRKKGKYHYLFCSKYKGNCNSMRVKEEVLVEQIKDVFRQLQVPKARLMEYEEHLKASNASKARFQEDAINRIRKEFDAIQFRLDGLLDMRLDKSITQDEYDKKATELKQKQHELHEQLQLHSHADEKFTYTLITLIDIASRAYELFESSKPEQKRQLINFTLSNLKLNGKNLEMTLKKPFDTFVLCHSRSEWLGQLDTLRTSQYGNIIAWYPAIEQFKSLFRLVA